MPGAPKSAAVLTHSRHDLRVSLDWSSQPEKNVSKLFEGKKHRLGGLLGSLERPKQEQFTFLCFTRCKNR